MFETFSVARRSGGLVASLEADRIAPDFGDGAEGAGAPDGSQPSSDDAHFDDVDGADGRDAVEGEPERAAADDDDDEEFDEDDPQAEAAERVKKLQNALKKAKRKLGSTRGDRQLLKELRDLGVRPQDLYADSREYRRLMTLAQRNPRLMSALNGSEVPDDAPAKGRSADRRDRPASEEFQFDDSPEALGFDPSESRANRTLADGLKRVAKLEHQLTQTLSRLNPDALIERVDKLDRGFSSAQQQRVDSEWNDAYAAASKHIADPDQRRMFGDLMLAAKSGNAGKRPAQFFVNHYLKLMKVNPAQAGRASAAAAASRGRVAERVAQLPRQNPNGAPAPARKQRESLSDVHRRIKNLGGAAAR